MVKGTKKKGKYGRHMYITLACIRQSKANKSKGDGTKAVPTITKTQCIPRICAIICVDGK